MKQVKIGDEVLYVSYTGPKRKAVVENIEICRPGEKYGDSVISCDLDRHHGVITLSNNHWCYFDQVIKVTKDQTMNRIAKDIDEAYSDFQKEYGRVPNVAFVRIIWRNDGEQAACIETIALDKTSFRHDDDDIFYYCESVDELKELTSENSRADFRVTSFISFDRF